MDEGFLKGDASLQQQLPRAVGLIGNCTEGSTIEVRGNAANVYGVADVERRDGALQLHVFHNFPQAELSLLMLDECIGDLALIENRQGVNRPQSRVRDAGFSPRWINSG